MRKTLLLILCLSSLTAWAQTGSIKGTVIDKESSEPLIGATVTIQGTSVGAVADVQGNFTFNDLDYGTYTVVFKFVGYGEEKRTIDLKSALVTLDPVELSESSIGLEEVMVLASVAEDRKTPVAVSVVKKDVILERASNQEFPELLKSTPGVYATKQGGGYGDSRINLRGFNSENVAVLINGVPVNDMENGRVYWSNWAGLTDVTTMMQVQRGLGASKVAVPSIGGTINILTNSTDVEKGGNVFYGIGNDNYQKASFYVSTGLTDNGWAVSLSGAKITGDGYVDGTEFQGYNYFFNVSKVINEKHSLSLTGFGAPQRHGQRQNTHSLQTFKNEGLKYNTDYGYLDGEVLHAEDNFYHKPQFSLNHYWTINERMDLSTAFYVSTGTGGGGGTAGNSMARTSEGLYDFETVRELNVENNETGSGALSYLRASRNDHRWYGVLSTLNDQISDNLTIQGGLDLRYYKGIHFSEVTNLLGADFAEDDNDINNPNRRLQVGDKRDYYNDGIVLWEGVFGQAEYTVNDLSAFVNIAVSNTSYKRIDYYQYVPGEQETDFQNFLGYQAKGGLNYNLSQKHNVFVNGGYFTKAPIFDAVFQDFQNIINEDVEMQKILSAEVGYGFRTSKLSANLNVYWTNWRDRTLIESISDSTFANLQGVNAIHQGVELDFQYRPIRQVTLTGMVSLGDWTWQNDLTDVNVYDEDRNLVGTYNYYISGLKVGNSAQTTAALGARIEVLKGFKVGANLNYYANNYADFEPTDITSPELKTQSWEIPEYFNLDLNANYTFQIGEIESILYGNVNNALDAEYVTDARSGGINDVYMGTGRQWTLGMRIKF
ncbi:TonB-dependent receptor [Reichenbachiella ulvae]|uniref:TonB-dependent receptor n=1 Tax=Reichenbachiella ulvae TaxID=2980104 RepID=A0ABT3CT82_9BACT|nr:TonB-dependent receptor [Reichenbachiella ulvae]MCV9386915.1 TonB-dependent receptor [Reichenbachiella ulvae]